MKMENTVCDLSSVLVTVPKEKRVLQGKSRGWGMQKKELHCGVTMNADKALLY